MRIKIADVSSSSVRSIAKQIGGLCFAHSSNYTKEYQRRVYRVDIAYQVGQVDKRAFLVLQVGPPCIRIRIDPVGRRKRRVAESCCLQEMSEMVVGGVLLKGLYEELVIFSGTRRVTVDHAEKEKFGPAQRDFDPQCIADGGRGGVREDNRDGRAVLPPRQTMFSYVVTQLPTEVAAEVIDLIDPMPVLNLYTTLKAAVINEQSLRTKRICRNCLQGRTGQSHTFATATAHAKPCMREVF
ncbi:hypothetical protein T265_08358 [Opisthorchis viverrini]|uniref:DUF7041 domain-containing protein n=1 Tax=Opisthorchis viverrini TaxID=6198 RepID=A0A074Z9R3_OPIVI|nr:hypothetical protein T265_08358 [Opisthorchis viverrini]KER23858.1 hypothetical protein T265_08358 [Opisthorchis viverrini]